LDWITPTVFFPLAWGFVLLIASQSKWGENNASRLALVGTLITLVFSIGLLAEYGLQPLNWKFGSFSEYVSYHWLPQLGINLSFGVDGISVPLVLLTTITMVVVVLSSSRVIEHRKALYYSLIMISEAGVLGVFTSLDLFVFYIFWELVLIPMFFLIGIWGGPRRVYSAYKFLIYTHVGSVAMLVGFFIAYFSTGGVSFNLMFIAQQLTSPSFPEYLKVAVFTALVLGFLVKMPVFPFHTWLPDAHVEAPSPVSVVLASLLLKMGGYGMIRLAFEMIPSVAQRYAYPIMVLGIVSAVYAALVAYRQDDVKRMVAFSSISHMGFVLVGVATLTSIGIVGSVFQMFSHGIIVGSLFLLSGFVGETAGTRQISRLGGLAKLIPRLGGLMTFTSLASVGLPGLSGFVAEFMILTAAFSHGFAVGISFAAVLALSAGYYMWMLQRMVFSKTKQIETHGDLSGSELVGLAVFSAIIIILGVYPYLLTSYISPTAGLIVHTTGW
jgi:proton-translocating NADH-quinone oxidoreductase chain M